MAKALLAFLLFSSCFLRSYAAPMPSCMTDQDAQKIAEKYRDWDSTMSANIIKHIVTDDVIAQSDSMATVITLGDGVLDGSPELNGLGDFLQLTEQDRRAAMPMHILNVWHNCDTVTVRYVLGSSKYADNNQLKKEIQGIEVLEVVPRDRKEGHKVFEEFGAYRIKAMYGEYNTIAAYVDRTAEA